MKRIECAICVFTIATIVGFYILVAVLSVSFTDSSTSMADSFAKQNQTGRNPVVVGP